MSRRSNTEDLSAKELVAKYEDGATSYEIAELLGVSQTSALKFLHKHGAAVRQVGGVPGKPIPKNKRPRYTKPSELINALGCTLAERDAIADSADFRTCNWRRYLQQRRRARGRGIQWLFTFPTWWAVWVDSGKWSERGRHGFVMARNGDVGPYSRENVRVITQAENMRETHINHRAAGFTVKGNPVTERNIRG